ncbi:MAG: TlpA family protein disulfide reductase [Pyrinomonadaceae bacterium]|nr:TlpA family protein disulfide reductase [Pyrinomonadaceae bacterium]
MKKLKLLSAALGLLAVFAFGASAQSVVFSSLDGDKIDLNAQKGKVVVLAIGAQWLPLSNAQAGFVNKLAKKYAGRDVVFYFISADSTSEKSKNYASDDEIRKFAAENKLSVTILRDSDGATSLKKFNIDQLPSFVILDKTGKLATEPFSGIDPNTDISIPISREIDKLL